MSYFKKNFKFPLEDNGYKGKITFEAIKESYKTLPQTVFDGLIKDAGFFTDTVQEVGPQFAAVTTQTAQQALAAARQAEAFNGTQQSNSSTLPPRIGAGRKVSLYLPQTLQFQDNIEYANADLGIMGNAAAKALSDPNSTGKAVISAIAQNMVPDFQSLKDAFNTGLSSEAAQVAALRLSKKLSPEVQGAIETTTGISLNPNRRSTLRGIGIRQFTFMFKMIPTSETEADEVKQIVQFFREEMYPDTSDEGLEAALRFPSKFLIKMFYDNKKVATNILPCFLANVNVVYNATSMSFHNNGDFQETDISLSFIEERALTKKDIVQEGQDLGIRYSSSGFVGRNTPPVVSTGAQ